MKSIIFVFLFLSSLSAFNIKPANFDLIIIDLDDTLEVHEFDFDKIDKIAINRKSIQDSILIESPILGSSTCLSIMQDSIDKTNEWKERISGNCEISSNLNLTGISDGEYTLHYTSCYLAGSIQIALVTQ